MATERPIRVLHLIHCIGDGGADHVLTRVANASDPARFEHTIVTFGPGPGYEPLVPGVRLLQVAPNRVHATGVVERVGHAALSKIDLVHGWVSHPAIIAATLGATLGIPVVLRQPTNIEGELRYEPEQAASYWTQLRLAYRSADAVVLPSPALADSTLRMCGRASLVVVPNAIDVEKYEPWRPRARGPFTMGFVGRLCRQKDPLTLIEACGLLGHAVDWHLKIFGHGPLCAEVLARVDALGLGYRVTFVGFDRAWATADAGLDAFVLPTRFEGMSNAVLEAAAAGLPIVTTDIAENRAVLTDGDDALLVPAEDPAALADAIVRMASEPVLARTLGARARQNVRRFSTAAMVAAHEALYTRLAAARGALPSAA